VYKKADQKKESCAASDITRVPSKSRALGVHVLQNFFMANRSAVGVISFFSAFKEICPQAKSPSPPPLSCQEFCFLFIIIEIQMFPPIIKSEGD
jgi:hypothetical protein